MSRQEKTGTPVAMAGFGKRDMRAQFAALPWRKRGDRIEVVLVTTRDTGRWVVPKGWPMEGHTPAEAAAVEAEEEAGVRGVATERCIGLFTYVKELPEGDLPVACAVYPVEISKLLDSWPEQDERQRQIVSLKKAAKIVSDPDLGRLLADPTLPKLLR